MSAPIFIAKSKGYFAEEGLDVTLLPFTAGREGLEAMLAGKADIAAAGDTPTMYAIAQGRKLCVLAAIADSDRLWREKTGVFSTPRT